MPDFGELARGGVVAQPPRPKRDELENVRRAQLGSSAAFDELVRQRAPDLYRYLVIRLRNESDARDALQETLTAAWRALPTLTRPDKFWPWLVTIAARKAASIHRARVPTADVDVALIPDPDESSRELWDAVGRLPPAYRDVLVLRYRLQLSEKEVADALGVRVSTVKSRSFAARKALKELLA